MKNTSEVGVRITPIQDMRIACWTDSSLYGSEGEPLGDDDLQGFDKHKVYSQGGCVLGFMDRTQLEQTDEVKVSFIDWRSRASKRVFHSTFGAETGAALEAVGMAHYLRGFMCDILLGAKRLLEVTTMVKIIFPS